MPPRRRLLVLALGPLIALAACAPVPKRAANPQSERLGGAVSQAATAGRCTAALEMLDALATRDPGYRETIAANADVRACLAAAAVARPPVITRRARYTTSIVERDGLAAGVFVVGAGTVLYAIHDVGEYRPAPRLPLYGGLATLLVASSLYVLGGPVAHSARQNPRSAGWSLLARIAFPVIGAFISYSIYDDEVPAGAVAIVLTGAASAMVLDWSVLAVVNKPVTPVITPTPGGATVGLGWSF